MIYNNIHILYHNKCDKRTYNDNVIIAGILSYIYAVNYDLRDIKK